MRKFSFTLFTVFLLLGSTLAVQSSLRSGSFGELREDNSSTDPTWTLITPSTTSPSIRRGHSAIVVDNKMIVFGGCYLDIKCYNDLYFYDLK